jgi:hypothetical protein
MEMDTGPVHCFTIYPRTWIIIWSSILMLILISVLGSDAGAITWEDEERISSGYHAGLPIVAAEGNDVYVAYVRLIDGYENLAFTMTEGGIWTYPQPVFPHQSRQMYPDMAVSRGVLPLVPFVMANVVLGVAVLLLV